MRARMAGVEVATAEVLVFLDSHCEVSAMVAHIGLRIDGEHFSFIHVLLYF